MDNQELTPGQQAEIDRLLAADTAWAELVKQEQEQE